MSLHTKGGGKSATTLGLVLRQLRGSRSQMEIARAAAISRSYLSELESDKHGARIPRHTLVGLAEALEVDAGVLLVLVGQPVAPADISGPRPDFVSFVLSEPTLGESARAAILAVYQAVTVDRRPDARSDQVVPLVEQAGERVDVVADLGRQRGAPAGGEGVRAAGRHGKKRRLKGGEQVADHAEVGDGPLGQVE